MLTVFGSANVDFIYEVDALPSPGETVLARGLTVLPGGKGANQALAAARSGAEVSFAGTVGRDSLAGTALAGLRDAGIDLTAVAEADAPTCTAAIWVTPGGENSIVVASGANWLTHADQIAAEQLQDTSTLLLQMEVPHDENWRLLNIAQSSDIRTVLNVAPSGPVPEDALQMLDAIIVNEGELADLATAHGLSGTPEDLLRRVATAYDLIAIGTLGSEGALCAIDDSLYRVPALQIDAVDTTGAGDAFAGVFAASWDMSGDTEEALRQASVAGALACTAIGAQTSLPTAAQIEIGLSTLGSVSRA